MKKIVTKFLEIIKKEFPELLIEGRVSGEETELFYYGERGLLKDENFQHKMGDYIEDIFEKNSFYNFYFRSVSKRKFYSLLSEIKEKKLKKNSSQTFEKEKITAVLSSL
ncbi:hypothetical protein [Sebaldella sp. S0638]|uniref:hypothetical protein n=1 Tax=Sebaldella sp. S0638 TaxID=2957809 RepID=UPI00209FB0F6|nr:hypothetical protein [Sebaldella sp. S0638]MCP1223885.1 hypothetical protein [Sebaldella sp. S0638]